MLGIHYEHPFLRIGRWEFLLVDQGWIVAHDRVVKIEGRWPTWKTFHWNAAE